MFWVAGLTFEVPSLKDVEIPDSRSGETGRA